MPNPERDIDTLISKIKAGERSITDERDRKLILDLHDRLRLLREEYGAHRRVKIIRHATRMAEHAGCLADAVKDRDEAEDIVRWIHDTYDNEETNRDYRSILRTVGKRVTEGDDVPDSLAWITTSTSNDYNPVPPRSEMLDWERDIKPMIEAAKNPRDEALVALQFDAGLRGGELFDLRCNALHDSEHGLRVHVDGKTGERSLQQYQNAENIAPRDPFIELTERGVRAAVKRATEVTAEETGDPDFKHVSSHDLRRRFAQRLLVDEELNPRVVMQVGGWDSFQAIEPYLNAPTPDVVDNAFAQARLN